MSYGMELYFDHARRELQVYLTRVERGQTFAIMPLAEKPIAETEMIDPCLRLRQPEGALFLQAMMDALWKHGVRPTSKHVNDQEKEVAAIRYHLEDMRRLAMMLHGAPLIIKDDHA